MLTSWTLITSICCWVMNKQCRVFITAFHRKLLPAWLLAVCGNRRSVILFDGGHHSVLETVLKPKMNLYVLTLYITQCFCKIFTFPVTTSSVQPGNWVPGNDGGWQRWHSVELQGGGTPVLGPKCGDSLGWRSGETGRKTPSPGQEREKAGTHKHTGMKIGRVYCVRIHPSTDVGTRTIDFLRLCNEALSPSPGSFVQSGVGLGLKTVG